MVGVNQFVKIIRSLRMLVVNMLYFLVGMPVDYEIEQIHHRITYGNGCDNDYRSPSGKSPFLHHLDRLAHQVEANDGKHNTAGKSQQ